MSMRHTIKNIIAMTIFLGFAIWFSFAHHSYWGYIPWLVIIVMMIDDIFVLRRECKRLDEKIKN